MPEQPGTTELLRQALIDKVNMKALGPISFFYNSVVSCSKLTYSANDPEILVKYTMRPIPTQIGKLMHIHKTNYVTPSPPVQCCKPWQNNFWYFATTTISTY